MGMVLIGVVTISALSIRPGGLRNGLRNAGRRLRLALIMTGIYLGISTVIRLAFPTSVVAEAALLGIAAALAIAFLILGQNRQFDRR